MFITHTDGSDEVLRIEIAYDNGAHKTSRGKNCFQYCLMPTHDDDDDKVEHEGMVQQRAHSASQT